MHQHFNILKPTGYVMHQQFKIESLASDYEVSDI
jgi:hypothetical protein